MQCRNFVLYVIDGHFFNARRIFGIASMSCARVAGGRDQLQLTLPSVMKETVVVLSFLIVKLTLFATVSCHQAVNPLKDAGASAHQHQHPHEQVHQQQQREAVQRGTQHQPAGRGIDRNAVHDQE